MFVLWQAPWADATPYRRAEWRLHLCGVRDALQWDPGGRCAPFVWRWGRDAARHRQAPNTKLVAASLPAMAPHPPATGAWSYL